MSVTALILAAQREGRIDPLAAAFGVTHKCVVPIAGRPLIAHVIDALAASPAIGEIRISIDDFSVIETLHDVARLIAQGRVKLIRSRANLADSVIESLVGARYPVLVTTADNVLLTPAAIAQIAHDAADADIGVGFTRREAVLAAHPDGQRKFYNFSEGGYSNCNSYWIGSAGALSATRVFRQGGQFAKHPARILHAFGLINLIRFRFGIGTLEAAFQRFSRRFRLNIRPLILEDGAVAIDVDNIRTHGVAEGLLIARTEGLRQAA
ncbi:NTP transferase domain-containing protein [Sphingobium boeckii]|uniref:GTP:adenosylcobinamide-phosphate guanylyltransferase n=1 Tax=Sphingobium boeckii TaxID=1082345 RepID=A0A7W9AG57_9SPHN|nr:NTP transferase domain-containing protein [Sphingobium boeckii]MBB5685073.1 GTP:adenosylcobinamide-phosphate guanylyltransferase [Sphingobium boeckii]